MYVTTDVIVVTLWRDRDPKYQGGNMYDNSINVSKPLYYVACGYCNKFNHCTQKCMMDDTRTPVYQACPDWHPSDLGEVIMMTKKPTFYIELQELKEKAS